MEIRSGSLDSLHARHMDGRMDRHTGKVNLTAADCCTFQTFSLTLTSVLFTTGYNYSTLKRKVETELTMSMFGIQAAGKIAQTINGEGHKISKRTKCKRRKLPRINHYMNIKRDQKRCRRPGTDRTHRNKILQNEQIP